MAPIDNVVTYHGTSVAAADEIVDGRVDVSMGGGELGRGFYLGTELLLQKPGRSKNITVRSSLSFGHLKYNFGLSTLERLVGRMQWKREQSFGSAERNAISYLETIWFGPQSSEDQKCIAINTNGNPILASDF